MKRFTWSLIVIAACVAAVPARAQQREFLCAFTGFDYTLPATPQNGIPTPFLSDGDGYRAVGFVTSFSSLFNGVLLNGAEHTVYLQDALAVFTVFSDNVLQVQFAPHARIRIYEDSANNADYGVNPPSALSPATFTDGTLILGADVGNLVLQYDYDSNQGAFIGNATLDEGSDLYVIPPTRRAGWVLSGTAGRPNATIPAGYVNQLSGEMQIPGATAARPRTWGNLKALYR